MKFVFAIIMLIVSQISLAARCPDPEDFTCDQRYSCRTPWGSALFNGHSVYAYENSNVRAPNECRGETRTCADGYLSGSFTEVSCSVAPGRDDFE